MAQTNKVPDIAVAAAPEVEGVETKRQKFERIAASRVNRALSSIRLLGNLATYNYEWDADDIEKIRKAVIATTDEALARFTKRPKTREKPVFSLEKEEEPTQH